ncbi:MAG: Rnf-Nqr domain containing protein [Gammaproteobacteria bacterium]
MEQAVALMLAGAVGSDLLLVHLIGVCPALAISRKLETAAGLAISNVVVAPLGCLLSYTLIGLLPASGATTILALPIIVVSCLVCIYFVASIGERVWLKGHDWLEPFVPLMTVNCTLLGVVLIVMLAPPGPLAVLLHGAGLAAGYGIFLIVFSQIRERLAAAPVPAAFRDAPVALLSIAIIGMALSGFGG